MAQLDSAVETLRGRILSGDLAPGERLGETELATELSMSRTPVREALRLLAAEGLVEIVSNRGARVIEWSAEELDYVFEVRARLEGLAARRAAELITREEVDRLHAIASAIADHAQPGPTQDLTAVQRLNTEFHRGLTDIAGSSTLRVALAGVVHAAVINRTQESFDDEALDRSVRHHLEIVAALRAGDGDWAESTMHSHLLSARASLLGPRRELSDTKEPHPDDL
jgi:DNA-binding GntR family transcriptional regulator